MRWIDDHDSFNRVNSEARLASQIDESGEPSNLDCLLFDSARLNSAEFFELLRNLMSWSGGASSYYLVLSPDPVSYFQRHFGRYPLFEMSANDTAEQYLSLLNEDPGGNPADAVGINWSRFVILPAPCSWFVLGTRDDANDLGGHLWVPSNWKTRVVEAYPYVR